MLFMEVSAKTGHNITESFGELSKKIIEKKAEGNPGVDVVSGVNLKDKKGTEKRKCECW